MATALKLKNDIKKLKSAINSKATPKSFLPKLKAQLDKAENELASLKSDAKPRKTSTTKGTEKTLSALEKLIQKKKYSVYKGAGVDLKKDAGEGALATGRRVSKGLKANQYGSKGDNKGNVYYEYRPNRLDVKQPKKAQKYPKLEKGGMMADGGETSSKVFNTKLNVGKAKYVVSYHDGKKTHKDGSPFYDMQIFKNMKDFMNFKKKLKSEGYKEYADGGMMAKGGETDFDYELKVRPDFKYKDTAKRWLDDNDKDSLTYKLAVLLIRGKKNPDEMLGITDDSKYARILRRLEKISGESKHEMSWRTENYTLSEAENWTRDSLNEVFYVHGNDDKMADGGMMAKGGKLKVGGDDFSFLLELSDKELSKRLDLVRKQQDINAKQYFEAKEKGNNTKNIEESGKRLHNQETAIIEARIRKNKYADGGMMADGGEVGEGFLIRDMKQKLNRMFPDSFGFTVNNFSKEGDVFKNSSALIVDTNESFYGLEDSQIKSRLFFPQYKRDHDIRFRIYQGDENTYFYFLLESENGDQYIGQFGFKDRVDVSADYITRFISFLMEQYGLPFQVKHSIMAYGGELHKTEA